MIRSFFRAFLDIAVATVFFAILGMALLGCGSTSIDNPPSGLCRGAVQALNEAQRIQDPVPWGCAQSGAVDTACVERQALEQYMALGSPARWKFEALADCLNVACGEPVGIAWTADACADHAAVSQCYTLLEECLGD